MAPGVRPAVAGRGVWRIWGYDRESGQFTQQDPIGLAGGLNLYGSRTAIR